MNNYKVKYYNYNVKKFNFIQLVEELFNIDDLSQLHNRLKRNYTELFSLENDSSTIFHKIFYQKLNSDWIEFKNIYNCFIKENILNIFGVENIIYQTAPTFRIQLPNNIAVGGKKGTSNSLFGFHRDTDNGYNHPFNEYNFIIPLTDSKGTASTYIETFPGSKIFEPALMQKGQYFQFKGGECLHGNKPNLTKKCRLSLDFRILLLDDYIPSNDKISNKTNNKFIIGQYYNIIKPIDEN